jgi:hypothetical protein
MLDDKLRGMLEKIIDQSVESLPSSSPSMNARREAGLNVQSDLDYSLGYAHGSIRASFYCTFIMINGRAPDTLETLEVDEVIYRRTGELKNALSKSLKNALSKGG